MIIELNSKGARAHMRPGTGEDSLKISSVRLKLQEAAPEYSIPIGYAYQEDFAVCVAQCEKVEGIDFMLPDWRATPEELGESFRAWLRLPKKMFEKWREGLLNVDEDPNDPDLLPPGKVGEARRQDPLSSSGASTSE